MDSKVIIGLPAYNEGSALPRLLESIFPLRALWGERLEVVVVNDGSTDNTAEVLEEYSQQNHCLQYITHRKNQGLGGAMRTLLNHVVQRYYSEDILVTLDADNTHRPELIPNLVDKLKEEKLDLVIASRFVPGGKEIGLPLHRKICSRGASVFFKIFFPIRNVRDYSCGFRAYRIGYLQKAIALYNGEIVSSDGFECMAEILAKFSKIGIEVGEYPLELHYELKCGSSKMDIIKTIKGYFHLLKVVKKPSSPKEGDVLERV
ncbi:MAG: glycosyltransferase family 2 protein [Peptococcia bacterium]